MTGSALKPKAVIPGRCEASNPESRDSPMRNCASEAWSFGPSRNDGACSELSLRSTKVAAHSYSSNAASRSRGAMRPRFAFIFRPKEGVGNAGCPLHPRPRVHFVLVERTRVTTSTPESPGIPARNGFNGLCRALPGDRALCHRRQRIKFCLSPVGPTPLRKLDASVGASGPHDFAVRCNISRPRAGDRSQVFRPALRSHRAQDAAASTAPHPAFVTIAICPSVWDGMARICRDDLPDG
jgi:hypothetical protein